MTEVLFDDRSVIGVLGGTGPQGLGLARRFAQAGHEVLIGSRDVERAQAVAEEVTECTLQGLTNSECAQRADIIIVAVPYDGHRETLEGLREQLLGKLVVDCVNPLQFDKQGCFPLHPPAGSACEEAQLVLPDSFVTGAFHHLSAVHLNDVGSSVDCDVLVLGNTREATDATQRLAERIAGVRGIYAGRLRNAHQVEAFTANLISMNRRYNCHAGIRVTDLPHD